MRIKTNHEDVGWLIIWQPDYFVNDNYGNIEIFDRDGQIVARVNETIKMGGGEIYTISPTKLRAPIPDKCVGPYWLMGEIAAEK